MATERKKVPARFYRSASGAEPVRDWLLELDKESRKEIGKDIATVEYGWLIGMPTCAAISGTSTQLWNQCASRPFGVTCSCRP